MASSARTTRRILTRPLMKSTRPFLAIPRRIFDACSGSFLRFANRIVIAPMTGYRADQADGQRTDCRILAAARPHRTDHLERRPGRATLNTTALWNEAQASAWKQVIDGVFARGIRLYARSSALRHQRGLRRRAWRLLANRHRGGDLTPPATVPRRRPRPCVPLGYGIT